MKFTHTFRKALIHDVMNVQSDQSAHFEEDASPTEKISTKERGDWLWISVTTDYVGRTWDQSTDRASGDPYSAHIAYDWIGKLKAAPKVVSRISELNEWALLHTMYTQENTDVGLCGIHVGRWVSEVSDDGVVDFRAVTDQRFRDVHPLNLTSLEQIDLGIFDDKSVEDLINFLDDTSSTIREISARLLGRLGDSRAVDPHLIQAVDDESKFVQECAIESLGKLGGNKAIEKLIILLLEQKFPRQSVTRALTAIGPHGLDSLAPAILSDNWRVSTTAVRIIKEIGGAKAIGILIESLDEVSARRSIDTVKAIISSLGNLGANEAVDAIIEMLDDENPSIQSRAAQALGEISDNRATEPLIGVLLSCDYSARIYVVKALDRLGWKPINSEEESWVLYAKQDWDDLIAIGDSAIETMIIALGDSNTRYHGAILKSLRKSKSMFTDPRLADAIMKILDS